MKRIIYVMVFAVGVSFAAVASRGSFSPANSFMQNKLVWSQNILVYLARADFENIKVQATQMRDEQAAEKVFEKYGLVNAKGPEYQNARADFESANRDLIEAAASNAKDIDDVAGAYTRMVKSCVRCHKALRGK